MTDSETNYQLTLNEASAKIRARLAAVAKELRDAADDTDAESRKLILLADRFDKQAKDGGS